MAEDPEIKFNRLSITVHDFEDAIALLGEAGKFAEDVLAHEALLTCALICFCRPFTVNEKDRDAKASAKMEIGEFTDITAEEKKLHGDCMKIRNKAVAHAEWSHYPTKRSEETNVVVSRRFSLIAVGIDWSALARLLEKLREQSHLKRADYLRRKS